MIILLRKEVIMSADFNTEIKVKGAKAELKSILDVIES